ncbi:MAG: hypothetical protein BWY73_00214 [candidate division TA06 bacterium ADurb.Bin417]|uniref:Uncharacterized protein n=1 Tax=candidate division TA06 bacterium ADurb.Bin417 TaxID=1852828 RepID=A0A1V5MK32_UNCT6|nr:MAG: hypothetical protein BWY73_00214 [candidate division TA06 bacterium ADurb.Bin417]
MTDVSSSAVSLLALLLSALGVTGFILSLILREFNRPKFVVALILSLAMLAGGTYFCWRTFQPPFEGTAGSRLPGRSPVLDQDRLPRPSSGISLELKQGEKQITLADGETLPLKKGARIILTDVKVPGVAPSRIRVNVVGFIGNPNREAEDRNVEIDTNGFLRKFALNPEGTRYKVAVLRDKDEIAAFFLDLK